ncbi:hypothetical protein [Paenibacillus polysaccharolyticus]|nr:hypothetical protein [Paenibacillus polysaccharolyticus]
MEVEGSVAKRELGYELTADVTENSVIMKGERQYLTMSDLQ